VTANARLRIGVVITLLILGAVLAHYSRSESTLSWPATGPSVWLTRRADLMLQLGLMLVGALGIRALLPGEDEEEDTTL